VDLKEIKELVELVAEKRLAEFEIEDHGFKLRIRSVAGSSASDGETAAQSTRTIAPLSPAQIEPAIEKSAPPAETRPGKELHKIKAPIVGTFYRAPSPTSDTFVKLGSRVGPGTVLCIIEAMKLMNEIEADISGEVVEVYVENGQPVEYGQPLFGIRAE
jgi:acetyl-CoA carboxylase biotin carboxyl carrier protein